MLGSPGRTGALAALVADTLARQARRSAIVPIASKTSASIEPAGAAFR